MIALINLDFVHWLTEKPTNLPGAPRKAPATGSSSFEDKQDLGKDFSFTPFYRHDADGSHQREIHVESPLGPQPNEQDLTYLNVAEEVSDLPAET